MKLSPQAYKTIMSMLDIYIIIAQMDNNKKKVEEVKAIMEEVETIGTY